jgi:hypothetical protein
MGGTQSTGAGQSGEILQKLNAVVGLVGQSSPLDSLLRSVLSYKPGLKAKGRANMDGIYLVSGAKDIQATGLLVPSFQGDSKNKKWIVRETRPEMIQSRFPKSDVPTQNNIELSYMLIETILAITQLGLLSQKIRPEVIQNVVRRNVLASGISSSSHTVTGTPGVEGEGDGGGGETPDYTRVFELAKRYALAREYRRDKNPIAYNAIFDIGYIYSDIVSFITDSSRKQRTREEREHDGPSADGSAKEGDYPFHISLASILNSFSICRSNRRTMTLLRMLEKTRDGGVGILAQRIIQILNTKAMTEWLASNPSEGGRIVSILRGMGGLTDDIAKTSPGGIMAQLMKKNIENVINHMKLVCSDNPQFSLSIHEPVMLYEEDKTVNKNTVVLLEKYSPEVRVGIKRIFDRFRTEEARMQTEILNAFTRLFVFTKTPIPDTLSIGFTYKKDGKDEVEYLSIRPAVVGSSSPMNAIVSCFIEMTGAYSSYIMRVYKLMEATFTKTTRVV